MCDQNRQIHCVRGHGILDCDVRGKIEIRSVFLVRVVGKDFVSGDQKKITR
jgi:hypothetical protein